MKKALVMLTLALVILLFAVAVAQAEPLKVALTIDRAEVPVGAYLKVRSVITGGLPPYSGYYTWIGYHPDSAWDGRPVINQDIAYTADGVGSYLARDVSYGDVELSVTDSLGNRGSGYVDFTVLDQAGAIKSAATLAHLDAFAGRWYGYDRYGHRYEIDFLKDPYRLSYIARDDKGLVVEPFWSTQIAMDETQVYAYAPGSDEPTPIGFSLNEGILRLHITTNVDAARDWASIDQYLDPNYQRGDASADRRVDMLDLTAVIDYLADRTPCPSMTNANADGQEGVGLGDALWLISAIVR